MHILIFSRIGTLKLAWRKFESIVVIMLLTPQIYSNTRDDCTNCTLYFWSVQIVHSERCFQKNTLIYNNGLRTYKCQNLLLPSSIRIQDKKWVDSTSEIHISAKKLKGLSRNESLRWKYRCFSSKFRWTEWHGTSYMHIYILEGEEGH